MVSEKLYWLSGLSLVIGGLLATIGWVLFAFSDPGHRNYSGNAWLPLNFLVIGGGFFMAIGLPGFYVSQAKESGIVGLAGFFMLFAGITFAYIAVHSIETVTMPDVPERMMVLVSFAAPSLFLGALLMAFTVWRAGVYPNWLGVAIIVSILLVLLGQFVPLPEMIERNLISVPFTAIVAGAGVLLMSYS